MKARTIIQSMTPHGIPMATKKLTTLTTTRTMNDKIKESTSTRNKTVITQTKQQK